MTFEKWMKRVDVYLMDIAGATSADLSDWCWWDSWNENLSARDAAEAFLETEGFHFCP